MYCPLIDEVTNKKPCEFCKGCAGHVHIPEHTEMIETGDGDVDELVVPESHECVL